MVLLFLICFSVGERLEYTATFSFLHLGSMTLEVEDTITYNNTDCYLLSSILSSNQNLKFLFSLNDTVHVFARRNGLLPLFYEKKVHEGDYYNHSKIHFNHDDLSAMYDDSIPLDLLGDSRDILTFWYYLRTIPLIIGDTIIFHIHESKNNYEVNCFVSKKETITTSIGSFNTIMVEPRTGEKGMFSSKGGMQIWYSDDDMRYPVQIKTKMNFGSILFKLKGVVN
jgi:hypothetical protein